MAISVEEKAAEIVSRQPQVAKAVYDMMRFRTGVDERYSLTRRQSELLTFIRGYHEEHGVTPTFDEMKNAVGLASKSGVHRLVEALVERGHISRLYNRARSITLEGA